MPTCGAMPTSSGWTVTGSPLIWIKCATPITRSIPTLDARMPLLAENEIEELIDIRAERWQEDRELVVAQQRALAL